MYKQLILDLVKIINEDGYLSIVLDNSIKTLKLEDHDRRLYTKILYGVVEKKMLLDYYLQPYIKGKRTKAFIKNTLRVGAYCIDYTNIANHFIINELVSIVKKEDFRASQFINAILRAYIKDERRTLGNLSETSRISLEIGLNEEITDMLLKQYKNNVESFFEPAETSNTYRINTLKISIDDLHHELDNMNISYEAYDEAIITKESLLHTDLFKSGKIIAQDLSSMQVAKVAYEPRFNEALDCCSAPGGKSLHLAALMKNKGNILSCDIYSNKLDKIKENALKLGVTNITTLEASATDFDYGKQFDLVIADVPCSGLGVIRHKPDLKLRMTMNKIKEINELQKKIINHVTNYVAPGGVLVYSTCTINKLENEWLIKDFLRIHKEYKKIDEKIINPSKDTDGFYICKLLKEL